MKFDVPTPSRFKNKIETMSEADSFIFSVWNGEDYSDYRKSKEKRAPIETSYEVIHEYSEYSTIQVSSIYKIRKLDKGYCYDVNNMNKWFFDLSFFHNSNSPSKNDKLTHC